MAEPAADCQDAAIRRAGGGDEDLDLLRATPAARRFADKRRAQTARRPA